MDVAEFTESAGVVRELHELKRWWLEKKDRQVSDILDDEGHQYIDLVLEGGGVLGLALVGYTYALESVGIRFLGIGGTSAGAINAALLAAVARVNEPKSEKLIQHLAELDLAQFLDGDRDAVEFCRALAGGAGKWLMVWKGLQIWDNLEDDQGLNPGSVFEQWMTDALEQHAVPTVAELERKMSGEGLGLKTRAGTELPKESGQLAVVAADISTETKAIFPAMSELYFKDPSSVSPASFVRASMSIPAVFQPYRVRDIPKGRKAALRWKELTRFMGDRLPDEVVFVDGGIISNFPVNLFHVKDVPMAPTFGVKLGLDIREPHETATLPQLVSAVFDTARHALDTDFIHGNRDYDHLVAKIDTGQHHWLDFSLSDDARVDLFTRGVRTAAAFLRGFDWKKYKEIRRQS